MSDITCAIVNLTVSDNETWADAFQFGDPTDTSWTLDGQSFRMDIKKLKTDVSALLSLTNGASEILVVDTATRIVQLQVTDTALRAALVPGEYVYDLIMIDANTPPGRVRLMRGEIKVVHGITGD